MTFLWRRRRGKRSKAFKGIVTNYSSLELTIPTHFLCPISLDLMKDPVSVTTGITYDRENIEKWIEAGNSTCPVTNQSLRSRDLIPNHVLRKMIQEWCVDNKSYGVERIPTPRIPITSYEVYTIRMQIEAATRSMDERSCHEMLGRIKNLAKESERNKRCLSENSIGSELAGMFESFAAFSKDGYNKHVALFEEILHVLTWSFPIGEEGVSKLKSPVSLHAILWCLKNEGLSLRQNTAFVLKELVSEDHTSVDSLIKIDGYQETLIKIVKEAICNKTTHACLTLTHHLISRSPSVNLMFTEKGLIQIILELLIDGNKSLCEKALGVLDSICDLEEGRQVMYENALTIPLLVKKILRVSNGATEFSISALWKLIRFGDGEESIVEAVKIGAFQKLLVVLQVGCGETTKEKVTELLKMMSLYGDKIDDCLDSFKYVRRSS